MKHAYLILAHTEFKLLGFLVSRLDDPRNDIYIHFDKKLRVLPKLEVKQAKLFILEHREDVAWAHCSMIKAEYLLFRAAYFTTEKYAYYHLLSGVNLPLKNQDYIHSFFLKHEGKEFVGLHQPNIDAYIDRNLRHYHLFSRSFRETKGVRGLAKRILRKSFHILQDLFSFRINPRVDFHKGGQWVSVTSKLVAYIISKEQYALALFDGSFGSDEFFIPTLIWGTPFMENLYDPTDESRGAMRCIGWVGGQLIDYARKDLEMLQDTDLLFARKFNSHDMDFIEEVLKLSYTHG